MSATHPLSHLADAESKLIASIGRAADALDAVGTGLDAALARLRASAAAASERLDRGAEAVREIVGDVLRAAGAVARELDEAVSWNSPTPPIRQVDQHAFAPGHAEPPDPELDDDAYRRDVPSWLRGGLVGAMLDTPAEEPPRRAPRRDGAGGGPETRPSAPDVAAANGTHPPGRNGKPPHRK